MPTMNVSLSGELVEFVEQEVGSGEYGSASEVVREGLRLLRRERAAREERLAVLRREVAKGMDQAQSGRLSSKSVSDIARALGRRGRRAT